jgi:glycosyltransferase involved in cell wall biosynthesis
MKICYVADPDIIISIRYMRYFANRGHEVSLIPSKLHSYDLEMEGDELDGISVYSDDRIRNHSKTRKLIKPIKQALNAIKPDIIHLLCFTPVAKIVALNSGSIPTALMPWGADLLKESSGSRRTGLLTRLALRHVCAVIAPSSIMLQYAVKYGVDPDLCHLITTGTDLSMFHPGVDSTRLREKLGIPQSSKVILAPRQWSEKQNTELILRAIPKVLQSFPETYFVFKNVVGSLGPKMRVIVKELSLSERVILIDRDETPLVSYANLPQYYCMAEAVLSIPTWDTGGPSTLMETMSCGSVPIVSKANGQWVRNRMTGLILDQITIESIATSIITVLSEPKWLSGAGTLNHSIIKWGADRKVGMQKIETVYEEILKHTH